MSVSPSFRWLIDPPLDGPTNMARDEALLESVGLGESPPTLRFYRWSPPTISLGYFQPFQALASLPPPAGDLAVVRRQTGGGAILHDQELTYSLILPLDHPLVRNAGPNTLYNHVHGIFADLLKQFGIPVNRGPVGGHCSQRGPFFCFERHSCFDLLVDGRKIMGSAQRRTAKAVLQHGSLILKRRFGQQICAAVMDFTDIALDPLLPDLASAIAKTPLLPPQAMTTVESQLAEQLYSKYNSIIWTHKR